MARFLSNFSLAAAFHSRRRGYSSSAAAVIKSTIEEKIMMMKGSKQMVSDAPASSSWVPDPVTGYYRPANRVGDLDPAELRNMLLSRKS